MLIGADGRPRTMAAVFTPYHITPGGGEKYLLSTVQAMQSMGFSVDILIRPDNLCQAVPCVMEVATALRVTLDPTRFSVHVVHNDAYRIYAGPYDLFFALGNEKCVLLVWCCPGLGCMCGAWMGMH
jgi:hypothetical protein